MYLPDANIPTSAPEWDSDPFGTGEGALNLNSVILASLRSNLVIFPSSPRILCSEYPSPLA